MDVDVRVDVELLDDVADEVPVPVPVIVLVGVTVLV